MSSITEQFSAATKSQLEAQLNLFNTLASTAVGSAEKVFALNLSTTRASVEKSSAAAKKLLTADPKEFFSLPPAEPPSFDGLLAYGRELYSIASTAQDALIKSAQSSLKQVTDLAATKATLLPKVPVLTEVIAANEPVVVPKAPKAKPAAAKVIEAEPVAEEDTFVEVKADTKQASFPSVPPKPIALAPEDKPAKAAPKAKK